MVLTLIDICFFNDRQNNGWFCLVVNFSVLSLTKGWFCLCKMVGFVSAKELVLSLVGRWIRIRMDPQLFSLLDPDPDPGG